MPSLPWSKSRNMLMLWLGVGPSGGGQNALPPKGLSRYPCGGGADAMFPARQRHGVRAGWELQSPSFWRELAPVTGSQPD